MFPPSVIFISAGSACTASTGSSCSASSVCAASCAALFLRSCSRMSSRSCALSACITSSAFVLSLTLSIKARMDRIRIFSARSVKYSAAAASFAIRSSRYSVSTSVLSVKFSGLWYRSNAHSSTPFFSSLSATVLNCCIIVFHSAAFFRMVSSSHPSMRISSSSPQRYSALYFCICPYSASRLPCACRSNLVITFALTYFFVRAVRSITSSGALITMLISTPTVNSSTSSCAVSSVSPVMA